jgi:hypothetical protein
MHYHQTQPYLTTDQVERYTTHAISQEGEILRFFQSRPNVEYSPERVQELVLPTAPITSVRRALTNLTDAGELVQGAGSVLGRYGRPIGTWKLAFRVAPGEQMRLFNE